MISAGSRSTVLALNCGSSSLKFGLYRVEASIPNALLSGEVESIGDPQGKFWAKDANDELLVSESANFASQQHAVARIVAFVADCREPQPVAIGHRVVHGGPNLRRHCLVDEMVLQQLEAATAFAPLHNPPALSVIRFAQEHFPQLPQVACLDTAFHAGMPDVARTLPIPLEMRSDGIRRYGFHGLSCESIMHQLGRNRPDHLIIAHLGNGASLTAVRNGQSIDTSMGLTPTGGVIMERAAVISIRACWSIWCVKRTSTPGVSKPWSITIPASSEFRGSTAPCAVCMKRLDPTPTRGWQFKCFVIQFAIASMKVACTPALTSKT